MDKDTVLYIITIVLFAIAILGYLAKRDNKGIAEAMWKGEVNGKLDAILGNNQRNDERFKCVENDLKAHAEKITVVEASTKSAHRRLDDHIGKET